MSAHRDQTLILTTHMQPHRVVPWQEAMTQLFNGKVQVLEEYDEIVYFSAERGSRLYMPAVARLLKPVATHKKAVKFSRVNVFARDNFTCQFCGERRAMHELNYDHVVPRKQGGKTVWTNIVTSCYECNSRKGSRTPEQAGMKLRRPPLKPKTLPISQPVLSMTNMPSEWDAYVRAFL
jgi:5-methylcytosine-specific restriction endonuclease McrA